MKKSFLLLFALCFAFLAQAASITTEPAIITADYTGKIIVTFDPKDSDMAGRTSCYAHTGVTTQESGAWQCAPEWMDNDPKYKMTKKGSNWELVIDNMQEYYSCVKGETFMVLNMVFRTGEKDPTTEKAFQTGDMSILLYPAGFVPKTPTTKSRPAGMSEGIYYTKEPDGEYTATMILFTGDKKGRSAKNAYIVGDFNDWGISHDYQCYKDGQFIWFSVPNLQKGKEYACQYIVFMYDGSVKKLSEPYATKLLHPDDKYEAASKDPELQPYPTLGEGYVTVLQPGKPTYKWSGATTGFKRPDKNHLVIYEMWVHDFSPSGGYTAATARLDYLKNLGVNAIEVMPPCEFEGNCSWGYNPTHYFAPDKAYGSEAQLKEFIDECHKKGIAVIFDMVFNHATGLNPQNRMHALKDNPWFNEKAPHSGSVFEDWNHENSHTKEYFTRCLEYWLKEYRIDGYRMDMSHGLCGPTADKRPEIISSYYATVNKASRGAYFILEHWDEFPGEKDGYVQQGMMCWNNSTNAFYQVAMGYTNDSDLNGANNDGYVTYPSSHDEQRPFWKAKRYGIASLAGPNNGKNRAKRAPSVVGFLSMLKGPQMIWEFDELGYDYSYCLSSDGVHGANTDKNEKDAKGEDKPCWSLDPKPVPEALGWYQDADRMGAYKKTGQIIQLRTRIDQEPFRYQRWADIGSDKTLRSIGWGAPGKDMIFVIVNYGSATESFNLPTDMPKWYDYLAGSSRTLDGGAPLSLGAGDIKVYTSKRYNLPKIPASYDFVGVEELEAEEKVACEVYPRFVDDFVTVRAEEPIYKTYLVGLSGQTYPAHRNADGIIDVANLAPGMYLLVVRFADTEIAYKIIKQ